MKKTLLTAIIALTGLCVQAQLPNGSVAPDFTATDINGVEHHLYDYLDAGKTVIIDISATWCGPCWDYHGTQALYDAHYSFGPGGSDEIVVIFVEGDPATSLQSLYGTNIPSDTSVTRGNWTNHSPYPIINDADANTNGQGDIAQAYALAYFPTVYMICPENRTTTELSQPTASVIRSRVNSVCRTEPMTGIADKTGIIAEDILYCEESGAYSANVKNLGTNRLTNFTIDLKENGTVLSSKTFTNAIGLAQYNGTSVTFDSTPFIAGATHTVEITSVNQITPAPQANLAIEEVSIISNNAAETTNEFEIRTYTDFYPAEISWRITPMGGTNVVASSNAYVRGTADLAGGGGPDANTVKSQMVTLPDGVNCYKIELRDSFGDGWSTTEEPGELHGIEIYNGNEMVFSNYVTQAFGSIMLNAALVTTEALSTNPLSGKQFAAYPNPTKGMLSFSTIETIDVTVMDLTGKVVHASKGVKDGESINLTNLQSGMYIAQMKGATTQKTEKIIIE